MPSSRYGRDDRERGSSRALEESTRGSQSRSQALVKTGDAHQSSRTSAHGDFGRGDVAKVSPSSRSGTSNRDDAYDMSALKSTLPSQYGDSGMPFRSGESQMASRQGGSQMPSRHGDSRIPSRSGESQMTSRQDRSQMPSRFGDSGMSSHFGESRTPTRGRRVMADRSRLGGIDEKEEEDYSTDRGGRSQAMTRRDQEAPMTKYGGGTTRGGAKGASSAMDAYKDHDSDSDQEIVTKKRFSKLSGKIFRAKFPDLAVLIEDELKIKPEKIDDYCESGYIRLDTTKNRAQIDKLLKNSAPKDSDRCMKAIKQYDIDQESERHMNGGKKARSILDPIEDSRDSGHSGRAKADSLTVRDSASTRDGTVTRREQDSVEKKSERDTEMIESPISAGPLANSNTSNTHHATVINNVYPICRCGNPYCDYPYFGCSGRHRRWL